MRLGPDALHASRFALSPLAETLSQLTRLRHELAGPAASLQGQALGRWLDADPFADGLVRLVTATKYLPDFVAIPPTGMRTRLEDELVAMRAVTDPQAWETLTEAQKFAWASEGIGWADTTNVTTKAADVFARCWAQFVEPDWPRRRAIMERDIRHRAGVLAISGWKHALDGMSAGVLWVGHDSIQFSTQTFADRQIGDTGLVFVPHTGPRGQWTCESPPRVALVYPARGTLASVPEATGGVARLLGHRRAQIAVTLRTPATPSQLAALLDVSLGTVSAHLATLRDAGVIASWRSGRAVYYELTDVGDELAKLVTGTCPPVTA
ncbi:ArsR/SmtB family transcription factor [Leekyejoonella antrihumi]|uniref:ArsR/SmtB family transcription factor n=1 Tax=Leekyejoonella antrihumi TaxID=1660198 RepID=UPI0011B53F69|nr:helix-turn-helix domain-containing protein [Leekyejoonella antrihumi]